MRENMYIKVYSEEESIDYYNRHRDDENKQCEGIFFYDEEYFKNLRI